MLHGRRITTLLLIVVLLNPSRIDSKRSRGPRDVEKDGSVMAGISRREVQHNDKTKLYNHDEAAAFEHGQNHQPHEPRIKEKTVIHHDDESGQENERHGGDGIENESHSEKDGEIDVELSDRHERGDGAEKESYSGDENRVEDDHILKSELRGEKTLKERNEIDHEDEDGEQEFSGEDNDLEELHVQDKKGRKFNSDHSVDDEDVRNEWKHFQMHEKNDDEFGYITNEEEDDYSEDNDNESISGERDYDHALMKTMHVHHKAKHVKHPRDTHVMGKIAGEEDEEDEDEHSGEGDDFNIIYDRRKWKPTEQNNESEYHEQSFFEDVEDVMSLSGAEQRSKRDEDNIPEDDGDTVWQTESARIKSAGPTKRKIPENNKEEPDRQRKNTRNKRNTLKKDIITKKRMIKEVESEKRTKSDVNNVEDFYLDENDKPKARMFSVEMQDVKKDSDYGENINSGHQKINKRAQTEYSKAEGGNEYRRGNSRHLLQIMNTTGPAKTLPAQPSASCTHQALDKEITDQNIVYIRTECRLCQCRKGELICDPKPGRCDEHLATPCVMSKGELASGERHFDGCNNCVCRNGELLCTRIRCAAANYSYTNYRSISYNKNTPESSLVNEGVTRDKDWCLECDRIRGPPVCGPNWKTYRSACHAYHCAGFQIDDVKQGKCERLHPCDGIKCGDHEICIIDRRGPCLATTTRDGDTIACPQHRCVTPRDTLNCSKAQVEMMCGEDHNIYTNKCYMFSGGVALAYYGPCRDECFKSDAKVCGVDGETYPSSCHASRHHSHVDYPGQCDDASLRKKVFKNSVLWGTLNARCETVTELHKCPGADCQDNIIPEGSCCPICGTAISIRLDTAARDMISLNARVQPPEDLNRVDAIFTKLKNLLGQTGGDYRCKLTIDLADTDDISVVYKPIIPQDEDACKMAATFVVEFINSPAKRDADPAIALLAVAVMKDRAGGTGLPEAESVNAKQRKKRSGHHDHDEPFFNKGHRIRLHYNLLLFLVARGLYWYTNQSQTL